MTPWVIFSVFLALGFVTVGSEFCERKVHSDGHIYMFLGEEDTNAHGCKDSYTYERVGQPGSKYCFRIGLGNSTCTSCQDCTCSECKTTTNCCGCSLTCDNKTTTCKCPQEDE